MDPIRPRLILIICAGLLCRASYLGLPWPMAKWSGSILWGAMVYFLVAFAVPAARPTATVAVSAALLVEFLRLYHQPLLDDFRKTLAGALLLGRLFSPWNIAAYLFGIACATIAAGFGRCRPDHRLRRRGDRAA